MKYRKVNKRDISETMRFDGSYHNALGNVYTQLVAKHSTKTLSEYCDEIFTSGRNKRVYTDASHGVPFLSNSDASSANPFTSCKYSSKKYGFDLSAVLKPGMILTGRVGAIGQTSFVPPHWIKHNAMGSDNIIRVVTKEGVYNGFIYAFLSSKIGTLIIQKHSTGGVQPFITDAMLGTVPIPDFPVEFQEKVDGMIKESARLREEAADALEKAHQIFEQELLLRICPISSQVSIKNIIGSKGKRMEATIYTADAKAYLNAITSQFPYKTVREMTLHVFTESIFKREYVENGYPFMMGSEILKSIPTASKSISFRQAANMPHLFVKEGWILMTCSGSVGDVVYVDKQLTQFVYTHDLIRIVPSNEPTQLYLFGFLSSPIGKQLVDHFKYGSVIQHLEAFHVEEIPVPLFPEHQKEIVENVRKYVDDIYMAKELELDAIAMVEEEIEKWSKE